MDQRRTLEFQHLEAVVAEVDRLLLGHTTVGRWTLGQILEHLSTAMRLSMIPRQGESEDRGSAALRKRFFDRRHFPEGREIPHPRLVPRPDADPQTEADALREAIALWGLASGPFPEHPYLGTMSKDEWHQFHCIHCAHHLSFAIPK